MGIFHTETFNSLADLLKHELGDIYDAEHRIAEALPKMADRATSAKLKTAFKEHLAETKGQIARLEQCFKLLDWDAKRHTCPATKGLIQEGEEILDAKGDPDTIDAGLIMSGQRVEHYEIAAYGTARTHARRLGHEAVADLLQETLDEEYAADEKLGELAEHSINEEASI